MYVCVYVCVCSMCECVCACVLCVLCVLCECVLCVCVHVHVCVCVHIVFVCVYGGLLLYHHFSVHQNATRAFYPTCAWPRVKQISIV